VKPSPLVPPAWASTVTTVVSVQVRVPSDSGFGVGTVYAPVSSDSTFMVLAGEGDRAE
jgi:hypothetical protein